METLHKNSMVPLYLQLADHLNQAIQAGTYGEGEKIPSEQELMDRYGVSRVTVRIAMRQLLQEGRIIRKQGMGTFVRQRVISQDMDEIFGLYPSLVRRGLNPATKILSYDFGAPAFEVRKHLELRREDQVLRMIRQFFLEKSILLVGQIHISKAIAEHWSQEEAAVKNSFRLIEENAGIPIHNSDVKITAATASPPMSKWLGLPKGSPLLQVRRLAYSVEKRPVEYTVFSFRADSYEISTRIYAGQKNGLTILEKALDSVPV